MKRVTPRPYQRAAVKAALNGLRGRSKRALVVLATGLGKTLTAAMVAKQFRSKRTLFLVHNNFILDHAKNEFRLVFGDDAPMATYNGHTKDGAKESPMVFATWQTMGKKLKEWKRDHFDLVIVDEAHHTEAETYRPVIDHFKGARLGITATPNREDDADIRDAFGVEVVNVSLEEAIGRGWLPRIEYHIITDESLDEDALQKIAAEIREAKRRFTMAEVNRRIFIRKRDEEIARLIDGHSEKSIVFCASIKHANRMRKSLSRALVFHSSAGATTKESWQKNRQTLEALKNGVVRRVCAVNAFNEGVDVPSVGLVAFCRVTGSDTIFRQQLGRGLRPGKDKLIVLDFVGNLERIKQMREMMEKISDFHERAASKRKCASGSRDRRRFVVSGQGFEFTFSERVVDLMEVLDHCEQDWYPTLTEASLAAQRLAIVGDRDYHKRYKEDPRLPSNPKVTYGGEWYSDGWTIPKFLGIEFYSTVMEASVAARRLGITCRREYLKRYKEDPRLPSNPSETYESEWKEGNWNYLKFLGKDKKKFYPNLISASKAVRRLVIRNRDEYDGRYKEDARLPSCPSVFYDREWRSDQWNWQKFLGSKARNPT